MKNSRHIVLSILLTLALVSAPATLAGPSAPAFDGAGLVDLLGSWLGELTSIFSSSDSGAHDRDDDGGDAKPPQPPPPTPNAVPVLVPNG